MERSGHRRIQVAVAAVTCALVAWTSTTAASGAATDGASVAKSDPGIGSAAALANPNCDPATKRVRYQNYAAPLCVKPWKDGDDNGGATAQGVTATTIKVVVLYGDLPEAQLNTRGLYTNQATGENNPNAPIDATNDINEINKRVYETWGREVEFTFVKTSGSDEAAQRADAVKVASMKPFAVLDEATAIGTPPVGGGAVFEQAVKNAGVPLVLPQNTTPKTTSRQYSLLAAEFVGKQLKGGKAEYAGEGQQEQTRRFGVLHASNFDIDYFEQQLAKYGVKIAADAEYSVPPGEVSLQTSSPEIDQQIPTLITKLKAAGVNNLIMMATHSVAGSASKAMKSQNWFPEITVTSFPYTDLDVLARANDQDVWSHAFGLVWFLPGVQGGGYGTASVQSFQWFWGTDQGTRWDGAGALLGGLYTVLQFAGPQLDKQSIDAVAPRLRKANAGIGGAYSDSAFTFEIPPPAPEGGVATRGAALGWFDPNAEGPGNYNLGIQGKGEYQYLDGGKRYVSGTIPKAKKRFFDHANSTATFPSLPSTEPKWPTYPCEACPSSGNTEIVASASQS
jgi:hypothetical protein